jgi:beta-N-acetylhexosaminidase
MRNAKINRGFRFTLHYLWLVGFLSFYIVLQLSASGDDEIKKLLAQMTTEEKVGQLMVVGFEGKEMNRQIRNLIEKRFVGAVVLFGRNIDSPRQVAELTNALQESAQSTPNQIPLLIGIDQEGGWVTRLREPATVLPGNMALGATKSTDLARCAGQVTAIELAAVGVNLNFAPVMDVNNNPRNPVIGRRSFGDSPDLVSELGKAYIQGLQQNGVLATAKHFPGHGDTTVDSHTGPPIVRHNRQRIETVELKPFGVAIQAGVAVIMTAHIVYSALDSDRPATLSPAILTDLLRKEMKFDGLIITDDMEMKAIDANYRAGDAAVMAIQAGADMVLTLWTPAKQLEVYNTLLEAVNSGQISQSRLDESVKRILRSKQRCQAFERRFVDVELVTTILGAPEHKRIAQKIASQAITVLLNSNGTLPITAETSVLAISSSKEFNRILQEAHAKSTQVTIPNRLAPSELERAEVIVAGVVSTREASFVQQLTEKTDTPIVVIALASPYVLRRCPGAAAMLVSYDSHEASLRAVVEVLLGKREAEGTLPIQLIDK